MAFDQSSITAVTWARDDADMVVSWESTTPAGTVFQLYVGRGLAWSGTARSATIPWPQARGRVHVGAVGAGEGSADFAADLPAEPSGRAKLTWSGGTYLGPDIAGFKVYGEVTAGDGIDYGTVLADVPAYPGSIITDGAGSGGAGEGGAGLGSGTYSWTSEPYSSGNWAFGVKPYDTPGNEGTAEEVSVAIAVPPRPPAANDDGVRLTYTYDEPSRVATLSWLASPA